MCDNLGGGWGLELLCLFTQTNKQTNKLTNNSSQNLMQVPQRETEIQCS